MAFGKFPLSPKSAYKWYKRFTKGREDIDDDERPGGATTSTNEENIYMLNFEQKQCRISIAQEFFLFPKVKKPKKGKRFATIDEIKSESEIISEWYYFHVPFIDG